MSTSVNDRYTRVEVTTRPELREWLAANHASEDGVWLVTHTKASRPDLHVPYDDVVEECLCFGWIDSRKHGLGDGRSELLLTARRPGSGWSRTNKARVAKLEPAGLMEHAGIRAIDAAKADGSWTALDAIENLEEPGDLRDALDSEPGARAGWDAFPRGAKRATLIWVASAKRSETRTKRIAETAAGAARGERVHP